MATIRVRGYTTDDERVKLTTTMNEEFGTVEIEFNNGDTFRLGLSNQYGVEGLEVMQPGGSGLRITPCVSNVIIVEVAR